LIFCLPDRLLDVLDFLRSSLRSAAQATPTIFILDKMDLFCEQRGQALLYNLLDLVQAKTVSPSSSSPTPPLIPPLFQAPIFVLGLTSRVDILELLEKRVKSRFSHRILLLEPLSEDEFCSAAKDLLSVGGPWDEKVEAVVREKAVQRVLRSLHTTNSTIGGLSNFLVSTQARTKSLPRLT
jgi:origin recognition complex subunit 4